MREYADHGIDLDGKRNLKYDFLDEFLEYSDDSDDEDSHEEQFTRQKAKRDMNSMIRSYGSLHEIFNLKKESSKGSFISVTDSSNFSNLTQKFDQAIQLAKEMENQPGQNLLV